MTTPVQTPKLPLGRIRKPIKERTLDLTPMLRPAIETPAVKIPDTCDYIAAMNGGWQMLGNDRAGDCVAVRAANWCRLISKQLGAAEDYPDQDWVWEIYKTQNPDFTPDNGPNGFGSQSDRGMDTQTLLEYMQKQGGARGVVAFGSIDPKNKEAVEAAIAVFGAVWVDILVLNGNQQEFAEGKPWTNTNDGIDGGHAVLGGGYIPQKRIETWAAETTLDDTFWDGSSEGYPLVEGVWVPIHEYHLGTKEFLQGVDLEQLSAEFKALTGQDLPVQPQPAPTPVPAADPDATLAAEARTWMEHHLRMPANIRMAEQLQRWLDAKGL